MFKSSDWKSVCGGLELVSELVVPCIRRLSVSPQADDSLAVEQVRNCWCNFLGSPLDGKETLKRLHYLPKKIRTSLMSDKKSVEVFKRTKF